MRPRPSSDSTKALLQEVRAVYHELTLRPREHSCMLRHECCQFRLTGETPYLTKGEALLAAKAWRAAGRSKLPEPSDGSCPLLNPQTGRCMIYQDRPFACRTHFCAAAGGPYARKDVLDLIRRLEAVDQALEGDGARKLPAALQAALREQ